MEKPLLITFTGIDGSGKSTTIDEVTRKLKAKGVEIATFRNHEPYSGYWNYNKSVFQAFENKGLEYAPVYERLLQFIEFGTLCNEKLEAMFSRGKMVLSDRFAIDKIIYTELKNGSVAQELWAAYEAVNHIPDMTFVLSIDPKISHQRIIQRGGYMDWKEQPEMLEKAASLYEEYLNKGLIPNPITIDASKDQDAVSNSVVEAIIAKVQKS